MTRTPMQGSAVGPRFRVPDSTINGEGWTLRVSGEYVDVEDRVLPRWLEVEIAGNESQPTEIGRVEVRGGVPEVVDIRLTSRPGEREVRQTDLRSIEVRALVDLIAAYAVEVTAEVVRYGPADSEFYEQTVAALMRARATSRARRVTPEFLERVAKVYRENIGHAPVQAVKKRFLVGDRMASEYVLRARRAGLLPPTSPGKKKA